MAPDELYPNHIIVIVADDDEEARRVLLSRLHDAGTETYIVSGCTYGNTTQTANSPFLNVCNSSEWVSNFTARIKAARAEAEEVEFTEWWYNALLPRKTPRGATWRDSLPILKRCPAFLAFMQRHSPRWGRGRWKAKT